MPIEIRAFYESDFRCFVELAMHLRFDPIIEALNSSDVQAKINQVKQAPFTKH
jgi:hypothetical protein